jgi:hypothetical protein
MRLYAVSLALMVLCALRIGVQQARAQQAIVSLPSADVTPRGKMFLMQESQIRPRAPYRYLNTTNFFCLGVGAGVELAVTTFNIGFPKGNNRSIAAGAKVVSDLWAEEVPGLELKLTTGAMGFVSFDGRGGGHWLYTHLSLRLPKLGTRVTAGLSHGSEHLFGRNDVLSFLGAIEQPLGIPQLNLLSEWFSGSHELANFIYGLSVHPNHHWIFVVGHKVPTAGPMLTAAVLEVGLFF